MELTKIIVGLLAQISLVLIVASVGLDSKWRDLVYAFRRPGLLLRAFIAVDVVVPLVAIVMMLLLPMELAIKRGIVVMAASPLAPFALGKMLKCGADAGFVIGVYVALLVIAIVAVPATFALLETMFPGAATISIAAIAGFVLNWVLLPLAAGLAVASFAPVTAPRLARMASLIGNIAILIVFVSILVVTGPQVITLIGDGTLLAITVTVTAALAAGHWLGAPKPQHRMALAHAAATRHPGIAALIVRANYDDKKVMLAVVLFLLGSMIICAIYDKWVVKRLVVESAISPT